ncbi:MAG: DUF5717 family protein [Eubacterium sp.]|nr:DUF5717 family protein [Eubacterium sp.]
MQNQIQKLAAGIIDYEMPVASLSIEALEVELIEGEIFSGSFSIESSNGIPVKGTVLSSNARIHIKTASFTGEKAEIFYEISAEDLNEGDYVSGEIYIICTHKEFILNVSAVVSRYYPQSSIGKIKTLERFFELSDKSYDEAKKIFISDEFVNLFHENDIRAKMYYEGLLGNSMPSGEIFDEFLYACDVKDRCRVFPKSSETVYQHVSQDFRERFLLKKDGIGTFAVRVYSDTDFIDIEKEIITQDDFVGNQCEVFYFIRSEMLHGGKNLGRIYIVTDTEEFIYKITASKGTFESEKTLSPTRERRQLETELAKLYIDYRMNEITGVSWANQSVERLDKLGYLYPKNLWYKMMKTLVFIIDERTDDAEWLLSEIRRGIEEAEPSKRAFYLYLSTLLNAEPEYLANCLKDVRNIYRENAEDCRILWALLFMDDEFERSKSRKLNAIKENILSGNPSTFIYFEAYYIISQDSYLLNELGVFEINLVKWAIRHNGLTHGIAAQFARLSSALKHFSKDIFDMLSAIAEKYPEKDIISALIVYMIKCGKVGHEYEEKYKTGIDLGLKIAGMYENYIASVKLIDNTTITKELLLYFEYNTNLDEHIKESLIRLVIENKKTEETIYINYLPVIDTFAIEQIKQHKINNDLKIIYEDFIERNGISAIIAGDFCEVIFARNIILENGRSDGKVIILQEQLKDSYVSALKDGRCTGVIYSPEFVVIYEDEKGKRFAVKDEVLTEPLFADYKYRNTLLELAPTNINILLHYFANKLSYPIYEDTGFERLYYLLISDKVRSEYKKSLVPELFKQSFNYSEEFFEKFYSTLDLSILSPGEKGRIIEECIRQGMPETAYELVKIYGYTNVVPSKAVIMCDSMIDVYKMTDEDSYLTEFCFYAFSENLYTESTLMYLAKFYRGSTKNLQKIWKAARGFDIEVFDLEERILTQMLTTGEYISLADEIFVSYSGRGGSYMLKHAYYSHVAFEYILKEIELSDEVYKRLKEEFFADDELMDICLIAILKKAVEKADKDSDDLKIQEKLLEYFLDRNMYFAFYEKAENIFKCKYRIQDRMYMQFIGRPDEKPYIHYRFDKIQDEYETLPMRHMLYGIFVTDVAVFSGETVQYYITLGEDNDEEVMTSGFIERNEVYGEAGISRFERINNMCVSCVISNRNAAEKYLREYVETDSFTNRHFKLM